MHLQKTERVAMARIGCPIGIAECLASHVYLISSSSGVGVMLIDPYVSYFSSLPPL